jgi:DNA-binding beta-propeller fold protein YncE
LRWYEFNKVAQVTVLPAIHSAGIAFDGANMWVTGQFENTVTKIRANDGTVLGTFKVGNTPVGVAFDGVNVWVSNGGGTVTKLRASDGKVIGTFPVGNNPHGAVFGGEWCRQHRDAITGQRRQSAAHNSCGTGPGGLGD